MGKQGSSAEKRRTAKNSTVALFNIMNYNLIIRGQSNQWRRGTKCGL